MHTNTKKKTACFFFKTSQGILIHAFSSFGRRLNALLFLLGFRAYIGAYIAFFSPPMELPGGPPGALRVPSSTHYAQHALRRLATGAGPLTNALLCSTCVARKCFVLCHRSWFQHTRHQKQKSFQGGGR